MSSVTHFSEAVIVMLLSCLAVEAVAAGGAADVAVAQPDPQRGEQYRERHVLDPDMDEWVPRPAEPEGQPVGALDEARALLTEGRCRAARKLLQEWVDENPDHERYFEGVFLLGEALFECGDYYRAYEQYELVVENTAGELFRKALRREKDVALAFLSGQKRIVWKVLRLPAHDEAIEILDRIWERVPGTSLGEEALRIKADYFFNKGDMDLAQDEYAHLAREYPGGRFVQLAMLRSAEAAEAAFPGIRFDDRPLLEAGVRYEQVRRAFPVYAERERVPERLTGIRQARAEKDLDIARWYARTRQPAAAEFYYRLVLEDWPDTLAAAEARQGLRGLEVDVQSEEYPP
jgi:tetratricopeptide (TPR) repeat protein